jgi:uncharacterized membrane-anchored protein YhcB (DUF1043 family)
MVIFTYIKQEAHMKEQLKKLLDSKIIVGLVIIAVIAYFTQSYYKKTESFKLELSNKIHLLETQKTSLEATITTQKSSISKLEQKIVQINKSLKIKQKSYYANGQLKTEKEVSNDSNFISDSLKKEDIAKQSDSAIIKKEEEKKTDLAQELNIKQEIKTEEVKKDSSTFKTIVITVGSIGLCLLTHICSF